MRCLLIIIMGLLLYGCSPLDVRANLVGMYPIDINRMGNKTFEIEVASTKEEAFFKIVTFFEEKKSNILQSNKKQFFIVADNLKVIYKYCITTSRVAVLIEDNDNKTITIKVASRNHDLAQEVSIEIKTIMSNKIDKKK